MNARLEARHRPSVDRRRLLAPLTLCLAVGIAFVWLDIPGETRFRHALQNAGHGLAFAALAFVSQLSLGVRDERHPARLAALVAGVSSALFAVGLGIELVQYLTGRGASGADLLMNTGGIVAGTALALATRRVGTEPRVRPSTTSRVLAALLGVLALLACLRLPIAIAVVDALAPDLPVLATFERPFARTRLAGGSNPAELALREADARWPGNDTSVLEATFPTGQWPGFRLIEPPSDWRAYRTLALDVVNTAAETVRLHVRVDQRAAGEDIFWTASRTLAPGPVSLRIELAGMRPDVVLDPARTDHEPFANVFQVLVFLSRNHDEVTLLFDDLRLIR